MEESNQRRLLVLGGVGTLIFIVLLFSLSFFYFSKKEKERRAEEKRREEIKKEYQKIVEEISKVRKEKPEEKISEILTQVEATEDVPVKGVEIIKTGDKKVIKNLEQGYQIEIPAKMLLARSISSEELNFFLPDKENYLSCPGYAKFPSDLTIKVEKNEKKLPLKEWIKQNRKEPYLNVVGDLRTFYQELGFQKLGENNWYKIEIYLERYIDVPTYEYFLESDEKIYDVLITEWEDVLKENCPHKLSPSEMEKVLETFKLI